MRIHIGAGFGFPVTVATRVQIFTGMTSNVFLWKEIELQRFCRFKGAGNFTFNVFEHLNILSHSVHRKRLSPWTARMWLLNAYLCFASLSQIVHLNTLPLASSKSSWRFRCFHRLAPFFNLNTKVILIRWVDDELNDQTYRTTPHKCYTELSAWASSNAISYDSPESVSFWIDEHMFHTRASLNIRGPVECGTTAINWIESWNRKRFKISKQFRCN